MYSNVEGGQAAVRVAGGGTVTWLYGNTDADPLFTDVCVRGDNGTPAEGSDDTWVEGDYHLQSTSGRWDAAANGGLGDWTVDAQDSPCIDAGTVLNARAMLENAVTRQYVRHQSSESRPDDGKIDIGAFEYMKSAAK